MWRSFSRNQESSGAASPKVQPRANENQLMMLSPKLQRPIRVNENQLLMLAEKAKFDRHTSGYLHKRSSDNTKWHQRWFNLYQNLLFYYESESSSRPSGLILLEGSYCERLVHASSKEKDASHKYCLSITYRRENQRQYDLKASSEEECRRWIDAVRQASFNKLLLQREELEQKHIHLLQIVESEKTAKWQYTQQCEELTTEIKKLRCELCTMKKEWRIVPPKQCSDSDEIRKIKKVQSFFRGWLCRRRWKQIVEEYIKSPHAENMRKRNSLVFRMVETEEEYVGQLNDLITGFLRPFKMAASSKMPPCSHEDVNSIFLNSETILFLHQIFLKGLSARMDSWPTLVLDNNRPVHAPLGDLFDMLLPMLSIYQEYVRNHHFSIQVLTECKQQSQFATFLSRLEAKPAYRGRSLETFLTYPMHQIPRYILTLHELLAHTPHNHVERKSLDEARKQLEQLSRQMHDEVSETENIRKNLAIERMIAQRCEILLDVNQVFVRQGKNNTGTLTRQRSRSVSDFSSSSSLDILPLQDQSRSSSCFQLNSKRSPVAFKRLSIDFPKDKKSVFLSVDGDDDSPKHGQRPRAFSYCFVPLNPNCEQVAEPSCHRGSCQMIGRNFPSSPPSLGGLDTGRLKSGSCRSTRLLDVPPTSMARLPLSCPTSARSSISSLGVRRSFALASQQERIPH